jgi:drug/metabolite transporter (DMT)-like permease
VTAIAIGLCILCQLLLVAGQLLLKHAMTTTSAPGAKREGEAPSEPPVSTGEAALAAGLTGSQREPAARTEARPPTTSFPPGAPPSWRRTATRLAPGIACLTAWFFLWLGLLEQWDLSKIFPFEGLNPVLMVIGAWVFFRERMSGAAWVGVGLIAAGIALVSGS